MEEFNNKLYSTINFVKERKISDSFKTKYLSEVDEIKNGKLDNIMQLKIFINRLDDIQRLAIMHEQQPIQIIEESSGYSITAPPSAPPSGPPASGPPPSAPPSAPPDNEVKILRNEFGNFVVRLADLVKNYHAGSYFSSTTNTPYSQADTDVMDPDPSTTNYFLKRLATDKKYKEDGKGVFDSDKFTSQVKEAFDDILAKLNAAESDLRKSDAELDVAKAKLKDCDEELKKSDDKSKDNSKKYTDYYKNALAELDAAKAKLKECSDELDKCNEMFNAALITLKETQAELERRNEELDAVNAKLKKCEEELKKSDDKHKDDLKKCNDDYKNAINELNDAKAKLDAANDKLKKCSDELNAAKVELNAANDNLKKRNEELDAANAKLKKCEEELKKCKDEYKDEHKNIIDKLYAAEKKLIDYDMLKNEVYKLRTDYARLLLELRNSLETNEILSGQQSTPFNSEEAKTFSSDPSSPKYIINKLIGPDDVKGEKNIKSSGDDVDQKHYLDLVEGIKTRRFAKIFYVLWGEVAAYYTSLGSVNEVNLKHLGESFKEVNNHINKKTIDTDFKNVKLGIYRIAHYLINNNALPGLPNIDRLGSKKFMGHPTNGYFADLAEKFAPDYIKDRKDVPYVNANSTIEAKPFSEIDLNDVINLMQLLVYGISQEKGQAITGTPDAKKFTNKFFTWKEYEPMVGGHMYRQNTPSISDILIRILFVFIIIGFIFLMKTLYQTRGHMHRLAPIYRNIGGLISAQ